MIRLTKVLLTTDFSEHSLCALPYARSFAEEYGAELHCLHVVDDSYQYWMTMSGEGLPIGPSVQDVVAGAEQQMKTFADAHLADCPVPVVCKVVPGRPFIEIIHYARDNAIDLIVIATHGHSALKQVLMGGTADKVVHKAPCPVLCIRQPGHEFVMP